MVGDNVEKLVTSSLFDGLFANNNLGNNFLLIIVLISLFEAFGGGITCLSKFNDNFILLAVLFIFFETFSCGIEGFF